MSFKYVRVLTQPPGCSWKGGIFESQLLGVTGEKTPQPWLWARRRGGFAHPTLLRPEEPAGEIRWMSFMSVAMTTNAACEDVGDYAKAGVLSLASPNRTAKQALQVPPVATGE